MKSPIRAALLTTIIVLSTQSVAIADQAELNKELDNYIAVINGNNFEAAKQVMETLRWSGVSDTRVYDPIADKLDQIKESKDDRKKAAWYAKALGFSGNQKYSAMLESILVGESPKNVKKYAKVGLKHLDNHKSWNAIISQGLVAAPVGKLEETRIGNMLRASNYELMRLGAKRVSNSFKGNDALIAIAAERLSKEWKSADENNGPQIDGVAWLMKAVGTAGDTTHKPLLEQISAQTDLKKIKKYADKALKDING